MGLLELGSIESVAAALKDNKIGVFPCDTIWGILGNPACLARINQVKQRPADKPCLQLVQNKQQAATLVKPFSVNQKALIDRCWPGPYTLIFETESGGTLALRQPDFEPLLELLSLCPWPLFSTSVNESGEAAISSLKDISTQLADQLDFVFTGACPGSGHESTIVDCTQEPFRIIRKGENPQSIGGKE